MSDLSICPPPQQLLAFAQGVLSPLEVEYFARHLEQCAACAAQVEKLLRTDSLVAAVRAGASPSQPPLHPEPAQDHALTTEKGRPHTPFNEIGPVPAIPGYILRGKLGHGGMGVIYEAEQLALKRIV